MWVTFIHEGIEYEVSGWLWSNDGDRNGMVIRRADGRDIPEAKMNPGMVQTGVESDIEEAAMKALEAEYMKVRYG